MVPRPVLSTMATEKLWSPNALKGAVPHDAQSLDRVSQHGCQALLVFVDILDTGLVAVQPGHEGMECSLIRRSSQRLRYLQ